MNYKKKIFVLIILSTLVRLFVAGTIELGNDEVYYWTYALHLQYNYFDHPPLVGWLIRASTINLALHNEVFVRLGAVIASAICTWLIFRIGTLISNERTGWFAALLYTSSFYCSIIAGTFILPDSPQMIFWLAGILLLFKIRQADIKQLPSARLWICFGIMAGLCIMSKVHGVFLWAAVGLYALFIDRKWLVQKEMYISLFISLIIISPIIIWNIQNNFITYTFHSNRVTIQSNGIDIDSFLRELAGSVFYNNPVNFFLAWQSIIKVRKIITYTRRKDVLLLLLLGLPLIIILLSISLFRETLPHWSGPGYTVLILLSAIYLDGKMPVNSTGQVPSIIKTAVILIVSVAMTGTVVINFYPGTLSSRTDNDHIGIGEDDFTLDMYGWNTTGQAINQLYKEDTSKHIMPANAPIIVDKWFPAAHIDFYVASVTKQTTYAIGDLFNLHHYQLLNAYKQGIKKGGDAYFIMLSNNFRESNINYYKGMFDTMYAPITVPIYRNKDLCKNVVVYRLKGYKN